MADGRILELRGVTKHFAGVWALRGVDLELHSGEILALLGENGAGKSTLMKVLAGIHRPDAGTIHLDGQPLMLTDPRDAQRRGISIIHQEFSLIPDLSVVDNIFLGKERRTRWGTLDRVAMRREAGQVLSRLGVAIDVEARVARLSIADQQFVEIAKALANAARVLILDEPTATLTASEVERLFQRMRELRQSGVAMIFISHHLEEIFQIADRVQCLRDGRTVDTPPLAECTPRDLVRAIAGRDISQVFPPRRPATDRPVVLDVQRLRRGRHSPELAFELRQGEILGFAGLVGSGRTELIRALIGADRCHDRAARFEGRPFAPRSPADALCAGVGLIPEDRGAQGLIRDFSLVDNVVMANMRRVCRGRGGWVRNGECLESTRRLMGQLAIRAASPRQPVRQLSGGNQQKVVVAKWMFADCRVLIFDEPTRGIDVGAKSEIYELMRRLTDQGASLIMISSELPEVIGMCDRVIVMRQHRIERIINDSEEITAERIMYYATGGHLA